MASQCAGVKQEHCIAPCLWVSGLKRKYCRIGMKRRITTPPPMEPVVVINRQADEVLRIARDEMERELTILKRHNDDLHKKNTKLLKDLHACEDDLNEIMRERL